MNTRAGLEPRNCIKTYVNSRIFQRIYWKDLIAEQVLTLEGQFDPKRVDAIF
jgi:hypothetical protein